MAMNAEYENLLRRIDSEIGPFGYARKGGIFRKKSGDFLSIVEFQKSRDSLPEAIKFTVNLGVVWKRLLGVFDSFEKAKFVDAHLMERVGFLLEERQDKWWTLSANTDSNVTKEEVCTVLVNKALPYLERYSNAVALVELWKSGISPGLTKVQCDRLLKKIGE